MKINKKILFVLVIIILLIPLKVNGQILIDTPVNISADPGELKIIKVKVTNKFADPKVITPLLKKTGNLNPLISLKKFNLKPNKSRTLNLITQIPQKTTAEPQYTHLTLSTSEKKYNKKIRIKINKKEKIECKIIDLPNYVEKRFEVKIKIENKGNTIRKLNLISSSLVEMDNQIINLNPFQSKVIKIRGNINSTRDNILLKINALDKKGKVINLVHKRVKVFSQNSGYITYNNYLKLKYLKNHNGLTKTNWLLNFSLSKNIEFELGPNNFNFKKNNENNSLQLGTDYNNKIRLGSNKTSDHNIKFTYLSNNNKRFNYLIYSDFKKEFGTGIKYKSKNINTYLELKKEASIYEYYLNSNLINSDSLLNFRHYKINQNKYFNINLFKWFNRQHRLSLGWNKKHFSSSVVNQNYIRYTFTKEKKSKWIVDYRWRGYRVNKLDKIQIIRGDLKAKNDIKNYITYSIEKNKHEESFKPKSIKLNLKTDKYQLILKKDFQEKQKPIEYRLDRYFHKENLRGRLTLDNYGCNKINVRGTADLSLKNESRISFTGHLSYNLESDVLKKELQVSTLIPFKIRRKPFRHQKVKGKILINDKQKAENVILSVNGHKVKTNEHGIFSCSVNKDQPLIIKLLDLGKYKGKYILKQSSPYIIKKYEGETLKFNLIKYGSLKLEFKKPLKQTNKYLRDLRKDKKERAYIRLHNRQNYFIKEYKGERFLRFTKIPPGNYQITVNNISEKYLYPITSNKTKIRPGKNILIVKKAYFNRPQLNLKEKPENLKIKD